jgi:hypothetical protein
MAIKMISFEREFHGKLENQVSSLNKDQATLESTAVELTMSVCVERCFYICEFFSTVLQNESLKQ